jgi:hypothetical protein
MKSRLLFGLLLICFGYNASAQHTSHNGNQWRMQPLHMPTRWAKQVSPHNVHKEYPRPMLVRKQWENLNGLWDYAITLKDSSKPEKFGGKILVPFPLESALSGVKGALRPDQYLWYRKSFSTPGLKQAEKLILHFGAVDWEATVFVNGKEVDTHTGGYTAFSYDITDFLKPGQNELLVKVYDPTDQGPNPHGKQTLTPANIYYTPASGIWQTVWLEKVPQVYILSIKTTPDIDRQILFAEIRTNQNNEQDLELIVKAKNKIVASVYGKSDQTIRIPVSNMRMWSPEDPYLYDLVIRIKHGGKIIDEVKSYFGMRKVSVGKDEKGNDRIFLNNKYTFNLGTLDQGFWPDGIYTAPTDEALAFDIKSIKAMGFNTIRKHIKVEPQRWYYHADRLGVLVWQDFVNPPHHLPEGAKKIFEKEVSEVLEQFHNNPAIVTWGLFNEHWGAYDQKRLTEWIKSADTTRLVNGHSGELLYVQEQLAKKTDTPWVSSDMTDVHSYPDPMSPPAIKGKVKVLGEFGGIGVSVPYHQWNDLQGWGYVQMTPAEMKQRYFQMVNKLYELEKDGLSASIYTQPFDVEGEENGLMTYDREIIKIPVEELSKIHRRLVSASLNKNEKRFFVAKDLDTTDTDHRYSQYLVEFNTGKKDSTFLRRLVLMSIRQKDSINSNRIQDEYIKQLKSLFDKENLVFLRHIIRRSNNTAFKLFFSEPERINSILGKNESENKVREIIAKEEVNPYLNNKRGPDWEMIFARVRGKFGAIGEEAVHGCHMTYCGEAGDWECFGKYFVHYFTTALDRSEYDINNLSWLIFEKISDKNVLEFAEKVCRYNVQNFDYTWEAIDTHANILHKLGRTAEAIMWEQKALVMSNHLKTIEETLDKMKKGLPTWVASK